MSKAQAKEMSGFPSNESPETEAGLQSQLITSKKNMPLIEIAFFALSAHEGERFFLHSIFQAAGAIFEGPTIPNANPYAKHFLK